MSDPTAAIALLPCPWCGVVPKMVPWHGGGPKKRVIWCEADDCAVGPSVSGATPTKAGEAWNRRAAPAEGAVDQQRCPHGMHAGEMCINCANTVVQDESAANISDPKPVLHPRAGMVVLTPHGVDTIRRTSRCGSDDLECYFGAPDATKATVYRASRLHELPRTHDAAREALERLLYAWNDDAMFFDRQLWGGVISAARLALAEGAADRLREALEQGLRALPDANDGRLGWSGEVTQAQIDFCRAARAALAAPAPAREQCQQCVSNANNAQSGVIGWAACPIHDKRAEKPAQPAPVDRCPAPQADAVPSRYWIPPDAVITLHTSSNRLWNLGDKEGAKALDAAIRTIVEVPQQGSESSTKADGDAGPDCPKGVAAPVVPPREPTEAMLTAGREVWLRLNNSLGIESRQTIAGLLWQAMYDASPSADAAPVDAQPDTGSEAASLPAHVDADGATGSVE